MSQIAIGNKKTGKNSTNTKYSDDGGQRATP